MRCVAVATRVARPSGLLALHRSCEQPLSACPLCKRSGSHAVPHGMFILVGLTTLALYSLYSLTTSMPDVPEEVLAPATPAPGSPDCTSSPPNPWTESQGSTDRRSPGASPSSTPPISPVSPSVSPSASPSLVPTPKAAPASSQTAAIIADSTASTAQLSPSAVQPPLQKTRVRTYATSPYNLRLTNCECQTSRHGPGNTEDDLPTVNDTVQLMLSRLDKVLRRLCGMKPHREICDATMRVCYELRTRGYELFHLAGWEEPAYIANQNRDVAAWQPPRREISIVFMVPESSDVSPSGHRALAQILVHLVSTPRHARQIENVAVRYEDDWEDWTVCQDFEFFRDTERPKPERRRLGEQGRKTAVQVCEAMWAEVVQMLDGQCDEAPGDFRHRLVKVIARLVEDGLVMSSYEVDMAHRQKPGSWKKFLVVKVSIFAVPQDRLEAGRGLEGAENREGGVIPGESLETSGGAGAADRANQSDDDHTCGDQSAGSTQDAAAQRIKETCPAVMLVDVSTSRGHYKVKHIAVVYAGEWPISHLYRRNIPAPDMAGLADCVKV